MLGLREVVGDDLEFLEVLCVLACAALNHLIHAFKSFNLFLELVVRLFYFVLSICHLFKHPVEVGVGNGQFVLHFSEEFVDRVLSCDNRLPRHVQLLLEAVNCFLMVTDRKVHVVYGPPEGLQLGRHGLFVLDFPSLQLRDLVF